MAYDDDERNERRTDGEGGVDLDGAFDDEDVDKDEEDDPLMAQESDDNYE